MSRPEINRSGEMEVFVRVVEAGGFSAAARELRMTPSAVSKLVRRLEGRLGVRLVNRSTRRVQLTPEGCVFYERSVRVLADLEEAERGAATNAPPRGRLRVNANVPFGVHFLLPLVPEFASRHPEVSLDIVLTDEVIDILEQRTDVAVRAGPLKSSRLVARKLGASRMVIVGSPAYLQQHGTPVQPEDLEHHNRLGFNYVRTAEGWPLRWNGETVTFATNGSVQVSDGEGLRRLALAGAGLARLAEFQVRDDVAAGRVQTVLEDYNPGDTEEFNAVFLGQGGYLPSRVRAFLDFLVEHVEFG
ncbi:LysR family transcriptional regulator [Aquisalimonas lutea]|uniref:LysR family transcriptional regulator n=1 Tax=Aquisalimonas lutea TaxID=1327750 RepID=UPI0025B38729|nr:LysR family transcriptional regulator [Aquisalimonas lutea]MDN3516591.1 LysR family transcriptional regulator [Aquisalimonas lutea]